MNILAQSEQLRHDYVHHTFFSSYFLQAQLTQLHREFWIY